jgi:UDP:flavonoid glycosyltransferase YjiC (YdhE family)
VKIGLQAWGSEGDILPFTALAACLVSAGHRVTLAVTDNIGRDYSELAKRFNFQLVPVPNPRFASAEETNAIWRRIIDAANPIKQAALVMEFGFDPAVDAMYAAGKKLCEDNDAVVGHFFVYPLRVAAEKAGVPAATVNIVHNCIPSSQIPPPGFPDLGRWSYNLGWKVVRTMVNRIFLPRINALRTREGLSPETDVMTQTWASDKLNLVAVSPHICQAPSDWDSRHHVSGFLNPPANLVSDELPAGLDRFLSAGNPPVYMTFGSMLVNEQDYLNEVAQLWVEAARLAGCRAIIQLPWGDLSPFAEDPNVIAVRRAPYKDVFPRCAMVVHHGGAGTTQSALRAGRPSIIVAHVADQFFWGSELERLGVGGQTLRFKGLNASKLARGIKRVLATPGMTERATELGKKMSAENGVESAVQLIAKKLSVNPQTRA